MMKKVWYILVLLALVMMVIAWPKMSKTTNQTIDTKVSQEQSLPTLGSAEKLRSILSEVESSRIMLGQGMVKSTDSASATAPLDYSTTNLQVNGVDEADIVKNDGQYIYQVNNQELLVTQAYPSNSMSIVSRISFKQGEFTPQALYVDDHYLVLMGNAYYPTEGQPGAPVPQTKQATQDQLYPQTFNRSTSKVIIYDLTDKTNLKKLREVELDGMYVSSRKVGSSLYLIANKYLNISQIKDNAAEPPLPCYRDSVGSGEFVDIGYNDIHYFPNSIEPNYLLIGALDLDQKAQPMQVSSYLGSGQTIYASSTNLYVAVAQQQLIKPSIPPTTSPPSTPIPQPAPAPASSSSSSSASSAASSSAAAVSSSASQLSPKTLNTTTALYKFGLTQGGTTFKAKGEMPGTLLNQFAMDEANGYFRVATTTGEMWRTDELTSKNNVYILDQDLKLAGKLEDIAPGEKLYSVRFMGDRGYLVTFKNVDPFFVLDLKNPASPTILGALKIPGFSDYLQPYDENHIIGFGKETVDVSKNGGSTVLLQGLKLALFDVTDVSKPVEMFKTVLGDRGTDSEVLRNHKALLFDKEKGILSFPVTLMEVKNSTDANSVKNIPVYGKFTFQGAYVYQLDLQKGFTLRGKITHLTEADLLKSGQNYMYNSKTIERIIYIKDTLYTISKGMIKANDFDSLQEKNSVSY